MGWLLLGGIASPAFAAGEKDKDAQKLFDQAMNDDYLNMEWGKAEKKLKDALKKCGKDSCSKSMVGKLNIALGTIYANMSPPKPDQAKDAFVMALQADSAAAIDPTLKSPELEKIFKDAQAAAGTGGKPKGEPKGEPKGDGEDGEDGPKPKKGGGGDITYKPTVTEQIVNAPVPIYIEIPEDVGAEKATLKYKPFGAKAFATIEMKKMGEGFGVEIPCADVTTTGELKYYIVAKDAQGDSAGTAGSANQPFKVTIKNEIEGDAPSLPGKKAPDQCKAKEDCPPGLAGCPDKPGKHGDKGWGDSCENSEECKTGFVCLNGTCEEGKGGEGEGGGDKPSGGGKKNLISLAFGPDLLFVGSANDVCSGGTGDSTHICFQQGSNTQYFGRPYYDSKGAGVPNTNAILGGAALADLRIMVGFDRMLMEKLPIFVGARLGVALLGGPGSPDNTSPTRFTDTSGKTISGKPDCTTPGCRPQDPASGFAAYHLEARGGYVFGKFEPKKLRVAVFVNGGAAQVNASVPVQVCDTVDASGHGVNPKDFSTGVCKGKGKATQLNAYQVTGLGFVGGGIGVTYGITASFGVTLEAKAMVMIPTSGFVIEPTIGPTFGF